MIFSGSRPRSNPEAFLSSDLIFFAPFRSGVAADLRFLISLSTLTGFPSEIIFSFFLIRQLAYYVYSCNVDLCSVPILGSLGVDSGGGK